MDELIKKADVIALLKKLLEQARDVEAEVGTAPTAQEALTWAIAEIDAAPAQGN